ncbi:MAG TPA: energy transducer TonB [Candidatus Omnitrophota bacterium]|nr:energy transducer TonB [Candidatus Omnitrophota bacterium]HPS21156.1 energy transducer TonB [Candidatus Omnitrophota bacterium]
MLSALLLIAVSAVFFFPAGCEAKELSVPPDVVIEKLVRKVDTFGGESGGAENPKKSLPPVIDMDKSDKNTPPLEEGSSYIDPAKEKAFMDYYDMLRERISGEICKLITHKANGLVEVYFTVDQNGRLLNLDGINLVSGATDLKTITVKGIKKASPFPSFPPELGALPVRFSLSVRFSAN